MIDRTGASPAYADAYRSGYEAGRAAALRELKSESADATVAVGSATHSAGDQATADHATNSPALFETTETDTVKTPPLDEVASLHMSGAGTPSSLRGSLASLERQNTRLDADGLERILDEADLSNRIEHKLLVPVPASAALSVNPNLIENHRYCRPWTARFLSDLARAHEAVFHKPIEVNSAVRTVEYQKRLMYTNGNAAAAEGDVVSPHLTGATVDIAKQGLSRQEMAWMRRQLLGLQQAGKIDVEEEFEQACFHITVYKNYALSPLSHKIGEQELRSGATTRHKAGQPAEKPASRLPADLAAGVFPTQGR